MLRRAFSRLALLLPVLALAPAPGRAAMGGAAGKTSEPRKADLVLRGAIVHTMDAKQPRAEAVAVAGNTILAVGSNADVERFVSPATRVVDLAGATVIPGFEDSHAHLMGIGYARLDLDLTDAKSWAEVVERVARALKGRKAGEWVRGRGWHEGKWTESPAGAVRGFPTQKALSAVSPDNPVVLTRADGHAVLLNAKALALCGITRATAVPAGGEIVKDAQGNPTGVLVDNAKDLVRLPPRTAEEMRRALDLAMDECLEKGVTSLTDAGEDLETIALYKEYAARGRLRIRLYVMAGGLDVMRRLGRTEVGLGGGLLTLRAVKLYADGALGSRGAALLEPYDDDPGNSGFFTTPPQTILEACRFALRHGFQVGTHAIGDRANRMVLDAYEKALGVLPPAKDGRFRIEHAQVLDERDIPRFARLGVIASMQGIHCPSDRPWAVSRIGMARIREGAYAWRKLLASGARIINGTDAPVEDLDPIANFFASVARRDPRTGNPPGGFDPEERMTREEALRSYTLDAAFGSFEEDVKGSITPGKRADLTVLSKDVMAVPEDDILKAEVLITIVDGRVLYSRAR